MSEDEWLILLEKKSLEYFTPPARVYGREIRRTDDFFCERLIIVRSLTVLPVWVIITHASDDIVFKFRRSLFEMREITQHLIIEFFRLSGAHQYIYWVRK